MSDVKQQRTCIKFGVKLGNTAAETLRMLKLAFSDDALDQTQTCKRYGRFKSGHLSVDDDERCGHPYT